MDADDLIAEARTAVYDAYVPYSEYPVGAALETSDGQVFHGCNIEMLNYSNTLHAEELALATAVQNGHRSFHRIAVSSEKRDGITPCGMCRESLSEFCGDDFVVLCDSENGIAQYRLGELLPDPIKGADI